MLGRGIRNLIAPAFALSVLAAASAGAGGQGSGMTAVGAAGEQEVTFTSDGVTIAGSLLLPGVGEPSWPAASPLTAKPSWATPGTTTTPGLRPSLPARAYHQAVYTDNAIILFSNGEGWLYE